MTEPTLRERLANRWLKPSWAQHRMYMESRLCSQRNELRRNQDRINELIERNAELNELLDAAAQRLKSLDVDFWGEQQAALYDAVIKEIDR